MCPLPFKKIELFRSHQRMNTLQMYHIDLNYSLCFTTFFESDQNPLLFCSNYLSETNSTHICEVMPLCKLVAIIYSL